MSSSIRTLSRAVGLGLLLGGASEAGWLCYSVLVEPLRGFEHFVGSGDNVALAKWFGAGVAAIFFGKKFYEFGSAKEQRERRMLDNPLGGRRAMSERRSFRPLPTAPVMLEEDDAVDEGLAEPAYEDEGFEDAGLVDEVSEVAREDAGSYETGSVEASQFDVVSVQEEVIDTRSDESESVVAETPETHAAEPAKTDTRTVDYGRVIGADVPQTQERLPGETAKPSPSDTDLRDAA